MTELEILWPDNASVTDVVTAIETCCRAYTLTQTLKGTLAKYSGCVHWHFKQGKAKGVGTPKGVLEITLWPNQHRLWFGVHENRKAEWIDDAMTHLKTAIEACNNRSKGSEPFER